MIYRLLHLNSFFLVESERIELSSKQAIEELSTRLVSAWIFDRKQGRKPPLSA